MEPFPERKMNKTFLTCAILGCIAVLLGAFGAHGLEGKVSEKALAVHRLIGDLHRLQRRVDGDLRADKLCSFRKDVAQRLVDPVLRLPLLLRTVHVGRLGVDADQATTAAIEAVLKPRS